MADLMMIQPFIQDYILAISSILEVDVTVVDVNLLRVAGTGEYTELIGRKISHDSFFDSILRTGKPGVIRDVKREFSCINCDKFSTCKELANLGYPIFFEGAVIGVVGIIAFSELQREHLLCKAAQVEEFLKYMSLLLESKLVATQINCALEEQLSTVIGSQKGSHFIGKNAAIKTMLALAKKVAQSDSTVMISGESGTGKEVLAHYLHANSQRQNKLMVSVNCAAIPDSLVESELFGYEGGAFTGAKKGGHIGKFELANNGTIFLDEIGDMPLSVQTKLLRVLQEYKIERLGGKTAIPIDVRVICATNKNLEQMVLEGSFRQDLYYRLNVIPFYIPPLRERRDDIMLFVEEFIAHYNLRLKKNILGVTEAAERVLMEYSWPGNVRELKNMIEYLENVVEEPYIDIAHLPNQLYLKTLHGESDHTLAQMLASYEKTLLLGLTRGVTSLKEKDRLACQLGVSRATLYRKLSEYDIHGASAQ